MATDYDNDVARLNRLVFVASTAICAIAAGRCLVSFAPSVWFDVDPSFDGMPFLGLGPLGSMVLDAFTLFFAAIVLILRASALGRMGATALLLVIPGALVAAFFGSNNLDDGWRGATWCAGAFGALALFAALSGRDEVARRSRSVCVAVLLSVGAALVVKGCWQVLVEHAQTVAAFESNRGALFAAQGWFDGSPQALTYERRLLQNEATGWFGLSNIFSAIAAVISIAIGSLALHFRKQMEPFACAAMMLVAVLCGALVLYNGGKGAIGALILGASIAFASTRSPKWMSWSARFMIAIPFAIAIAVCVRALFPGAAF
ncbi:MAG: hypothetical protein O2800_05930, partial [Planctomycetota bacterium]|nr:hypothetical protein [Planctomycetota bacterium]